MSKISWKGAALLAPLPPVLVSCGTMEQPNVLTVGWTGITNTKPPKTYISLRPSRYSYEVIKKSGEFIINLATKDLVKATDFCGVKSGKDFDKFKIMGLKAENASQLNVPMIKQSPLSLECSVTDIISMGSHDMFLANIIAVNVEEKFIDKEGKLHLDQSGLIAYAHGNYYELGKKLGSFGFSVRKKKKNGKK